MRKKVLSVLLCVTVIGTILAGCGAKDTTKDSAGKDTTKEDAAKTEDETKTEDKAEAENTDREIIDFWYLWSGDGESGAENIESIIDAYNESQDKYEVVGLSVPDQQKIITAISGGNGPDITDAFATDVPSYAEEGIALALDELIAADGLDLSVLNQDALEMNQYDGKQYMMPINTNTYVLYYNKDLLEAGGYSEPPKTMEELFEMGTALTKVEDGQIVQIGLPLAESNILKYMTFAAGYDFGTVDEIDLANEGMEKALTLISKAVSEIGSDALSAYSSSANSMWWGEEDYFRQGMSVFRVDGPWFYKMAAASGINVGAVCIPAFADQGDKLATGLETSNLYIPSNADGVDGAWDFMKFFALGDGAKMFATTDGSLPAVESLREDTDIIATFDADGASLSTLDGSVELKYVPNRVDTGDINSAISTAKDAVILGDPIADIMAELQTVEDTCNGK